MTEFTEAIKDLMIPISDYPTINQNATLQQAVNMMYRMTKAKGYRWIIALDDNSNLVGFLTLRNVMEGINNFGPKAGGWLGVLNYGKPGLFFWEGIQAIKDTPVKKLIRPLVDVYVKETDHPSKAAEIIFNRRVTIVPVVSEKEELVGILRLVDLLPFLNNLFENAPT